ncbi:MAG: dependent oxidoreductase [Betaproteobacteria bacterium]|nr:dependent oxidoreductase [Betaproteobacteria bacterium]
MSEYDALVVGAGPAGATAALMLARAGWSVAVVEKAVFPRRKVCGEFISATSLPLFEELGIANDFLAHAGPPVREVGLYAGNTRLAAAMPRFPHGGERYGRALCRERFDAALLRAAANAGAVIWQPWTVKRLSQGANGLHAASVYGEDRRQATTLRARVVIAAHGSWEGGDLPTHIAACPSRGSDLFAFKAHFVHAALPVSLMPLMLFPGGYGGMVTTDGGRVTLSCCIRRDTLTACRLQWPHLKAGEAVLAHIRAANSGVDAVLKPATLEGRWLSVGPIRPGMRSVYSNRIFVVGNAAGEAHPIVAEGISMAIQSSWLLCASLIAHSHELELDGAMDKVARAYSADWRRNFAARIHAAALFANLATRPTAAKIAVSLLRRVPQLLTLGAHLGGKAQPPVLSGS